MGDFKSIKNPLIENIRTREEADKYRNLWYSAAREKFGNYRRLIAERPHDLGLVAPGDRRCA